MTIKKHKKIKIIDARGRSLGRVASEAARGILGKNKADYNPAVFNPNDIKIINISDIRFTGNKLKTKTYKRFSGYPSGLKIIKLEQEFKKFPAKVVRRAVWGMLPKNRSRKRFITHLIID